MTQKPAKTEYAVIKKRVANARATKKLQERNQKAAERDGFRTASEAITAWRNGEYVMVKA